MDEKEPTIHYNYVDLPCREPLSAVLGNVQRAAAGEMFAVGISGKWGKCYPMPRELLLQLLGQHGGGAVTVASVIPSVDMVKPEFLGETCQTIGELQAALAAQVAVPLTGRLS